MDKMTKKEMCHIIFLITSIFIYYLFKEEILNILNRFAEECAKSTFITSMVMCAFFIYVIFKCRGSIHSFLFLVGCVIEKARKILKSIRDTFIYIRL